jgi:hypothetical protein
MKDTSSGITSSPSVREENASAIEILCSIILKSGKLKLINVARLLS